MSGLVEVWTSSTWVNPEARADIGDEQVQRIALEGTVESLPAGVEPLVDVVPWAPPAFRWEPYVLIEDDEGLPGSFPAVLWGRETDPDAWLLVTRVLASGDPR